MGISTAQPDWFFLVFTVFAVAFSFWISLHRWDLFSAPPLFVGLDNFRELIFNDPNFRRVLKNTLYFVVGVVPLGTAVSLALALLCNRALRGMTVFRTILYLPSVSSTIAVGIVWIWLLDPQFGGVINHLLRHVGFSNPPNWLGSVTWAKPALIAMHIWQYAGYYMIIFLAGLQGGIPRQLYEAAVLDGGASAWTKFWRITLPPLLSPTMFFCGYHENDRSFQHFRAALHYD